MQGFQILRRQVVADVSLTARQWQIFSDMTGADGAASALNRAAEEALCEPTRAKAYDKMMRTMDRLSHFGASDTEPRCVFAEMLDEVYGPEYGYRA